MSLHVHRNSFNAGELSPLMDARVDEAKHPFSCRIMENFLPKIYGGAFRRPGTMYLGTLPEVSYWLQITPTHAPNLVLGGDNTVPNATDDAPTYQLQSLWSRNVEIPYLCTSATAGSANWSQQGARHDLVQNGIPGVTDDASKRYKVNSLWRIAPAGTLYKCTSASVGAATWAQVSVYCNLSATLAPLTSDYVNIVVGSLWLIPETGALWECTVRTTTPTQSATWVKRFEPILTAAPPTVTDDSTKGFQSSATASIAYYKGFAWKCTSATAGAATWAKLSVKHSTEELRNPIASDDETDGFAVDSVWVENIRTLYECADPTANAALWQINTEGAHVFNATRDPIGSDGTAASPLIYWINTITGKAWVYVSTSTTSGRFIDFNFSATERRVVELRDGFVRFWKDGGTLVPKLSDSNPLELVTPYREDELFEVQIAQLGNIAYLCHPNHPPQKLERAFDATFQKETFTWSEVEWSFPAFRDFNISSVTATPNSVSGFTQISFTGNPFTETLNTYEYADARIMLRQKRAASHVSLALHTAAGNSSEIKILGDYQVYTYGTFAGTLFVEQKTLSGDWIALKTFQFSDEENGRQLVYSASTKEPLLLRLRVVTTTAASVLKPQIAYLEAGDANVIGYARIIDSITFENSLPVVDCEVELPFDSTNATTEWAISSWAEYAGYPRSVCFHEQRLWLGGTKLQPNTIWASAVGDYENFRLGAFDSDSLSFTLAAQEGSAIQSMVSHESLVVFTQSEEWTAATSQQTIITPSNIFVRRQSRFGSAHKQAFIAANNLLFLQRGNRKLRQFTHGAAGGEGQASDLSVLAEHITLSGIKQLAFQQQPDPVVWMVRNDGVLLSMTYEPDQSVIAWARHTSGTGLFESVAVIYGADGDADQVWFVVNRGSTRSIERFDPTHFSKLEQGTYEKLVYVDCAVMAEGSNLTSVTGLNHLNGQSVAILAGGGVEPSQTVTSNQVTGIPAANTIIVGLPFTSRLQPSKIEVGMADGSSQGRKHTSKRATVNLWKTYGAQYADNPDAGENNWFEILNRSTETNAGSPEQLFTGLVDINNLDAHRTSVDLTIRQTLPLPCNVLAIIPKIEVLGK